MIKTLNPQIQNSKQAPLIVIVGETGSGKSTLAMAVAREYNGEIICADSKTIYKGLDIGTAKPSKANQAEIKHHLLSIIEPNDSFNVADFQRRAINIIAQIKEQNMVPVLVGGTGLYVDSVIYNYQFRQKYNTKIQRSLNEKTLEQLLEIAVDVGYTTHELSNNKRQLIKLIEAGPSSQNDRKSLIDNIILVGLRPSRAELRKQITMRVENMFKLGLRKEVDELIKQYGWEHEALTGIGYREFEPFYRKEISMNEVKRKIIQHTVQYAKRQRTWFKRNQNIVWFDNQKQALEFIRSKVLTKDV